MHLIAELTFSDFISTLIKPLFIAQYTFGIFVIVTLDSHPGYPSCTGIPMDWYYVPVFMAIRAMRAITQLPFCAVVTENTSVLSIYFMRIYFGRY